MENPIYKILLDIAGARPVSDFHIQSDRPIHIRQSGEIIALEMIASNEAIADLIRQEIGDAGFKAFDECGDVDFAMQHQGWRFRANGHKMIAGYGLVLRVIATELPHIDRLGLPQAVHDVLTLKDGLVLVTGQTGSGKSTSLAAMIDKINRERNEKIITLEDPVEFIHENKKSIISQREVGAHTSSFAAALRGALRQDPDIILLGELRDYETTALAVTAAETGHLVFGTLHTNGAPEAINRIIGMFPADEQSQARAQLSQSLRLVMTQQLVARKGGGRIGAFEVMVNIPAIANLIREAKTVQIQTIMQTGSQYGMVQMDKYIEMLQDNDLIE